MSNRGADEITEAFLHDIIKEDASVREIEPHLFSIYSETDNVGSYDRIAGIYDRVACNRFYNRIMWGYSISEYHTFCSSALRNPSDGWVLDAGCGSLAFTAETYVKYTERPVVLLDQSISLLRMAITRILRLRGSIPRNMIFLHADALDLPFRRESFKTVICMNLLHIFDDVRPFLNGLKNVTTGDCTMSFTTLVVNNRFSDAYVRALANAGALVPRSAEELVESFRNVAIPINLTIKGNLAFLYQADCKP